MIPRVLILHAGGTFGMEPAGKGSTLRSPRLSPALLKRRFLERAPEIQRIAKCDVEIVLNKDSAHMGPADWIDIADRIQRRWSKYDGIVLLHGTDTLAFTAAALSFLLGRCKVPVVITGAMRPLASIRTDARRNLISSVEIAARGPRDLVRQVCVYFNDRLFQGNRVRKVSAEDFAAFDAPLDSPLAWVGTQVDYVSSDSRGDGFSPRSLKKTPRGFRPKFSLRVPLLHVTPGFPARAIREGLLPSVDALVLTVFPSATAPTQDPEFVALLQAAKKAGTPVVAVAEGGSHRPSHGSDPRDYEAGVALLSLGCLWSGPMTPECAIVKSMWILGQARGRERFAHLWKQEFAGERGGVSVF